MSLPRIPVSDSALRAALALLCAGSFLAAGCAPRRDDDRGSTHETHSDGGEPDAGDDPATCSTWSDCAASEVCDDGLCHPRCRTNEDCSHGRSCEAETGYCRGTIACGSDAECPSLHRCDLLTGECRLEEQEQRDAGSTPPGDAGTTPDAGQPTDTCGDKYDCSGERVCKAQRCVVPPSSCANDNDCPRGNICNFARRCEAGCTSERDCAGDTLCHPQHFVCERCSAGNPCSTGSLCSANETCQAQPSCTNAQDCVNHGLDGAVCLAGRCSNCAGHVDCTVEPYRSGRRVCSSGGLCKVVSCSDDNCRNAMGPRAYCDTDANECRQRDCLSDSDCPQSGTVCNTATYTCSSSSAGCDQATFQQCDQQCAAEGLACNPATCSCGGTGGTGAGVDGDQCVTRADCAQRYTCGLGICSPIPIDPSTGAECTDGFTCMSCVNSVTGAPCDANGCLMALVLGGDAICL